MALFANASIDAVRNRLPSDEASDATIGAEVDEVTALSISVPEGSDLELVRTEIEFAVCDDTIYCDVALTAGGRRRALDDTTAAFQVSRRYVYIPYVSRVTASSVGDRVRVRLESKAELGAAMTGAEKKSVSVSVEVEREAAATDSAIPDALADNASIQQAVTEQINLCASGLVRKQTR